MKKKGLLARGGGTFERFHDVSSTFCSGGLEFVALVLDFIYGVLHLACRRGLDAFAFIPLTVPAPT